MQIVILIRIIHIDVFYLIWFSANSGAPHWISIGYPDLNINFTAFEFFNMDNIKDYQIQVSLDTKDWKTVYTGLCSSTGAKQNITLNSTGVSKYIRLYILTSYTSSYSSVGSVKIYGDIVIPEYKSYKDKEDYLYGYK